MSFKLLISISIIILIQNVKRAQLAYSNSNDYNDEYTTQTDDYLDEELTTQSLKISNDYYDQLEEEEDTSYLNEDEFDDKQPYQCPSQCKCIFNKQDLATISNNDDTNEIVDDYEENLLDDNSIRFNRKKRFVSNQTVDYEDDYVDEASQSTQDLNSNSKKLKYDIYVDCSSQNLNSISYLFSDDFPLDQIVSFNLSNNKFRLLRLDDGFEDLKNLRQLDLSSNDYLKSISPRNFLKKFRRLEKIYLNNLNQINCDQRSNSNKLIPIDCKWLRTFLYLYKRNISVVIERPSKCDLNKLVNSVALMSRCFSDLYSSYRPQNSNQTMLQTDNSKYEFRIEPELNQILIEGDTLELTCKLKKFNLFNKKQKPGRKNTQNFYRSQIKWYLNDQQQQLMISTVYHSNSKENPTQIQIMENKSKFKQDDQIESKLIITNTISTQHSGRYTCVASLYLSDKRLSVNTTRIEIKVLSRQQLNVLETSQQKNADLSKSKLYCSEMITQTYKGVYKWPRTLSGSKITQKCAFNPNPNSTGNRNDFAIFECLPDAKWSDHMELSSCQFESNLTRFLNQMVITKSAQIGLEEFIKKIVSIQSTSITNSSSHTSLNMYDIILMQKYLLTSFSLNRTILMESATWKHEFLFLNDMLSRLNQFYTKQAQIIDPDTFSKYFFDSLFQIVLSNFDSDKNKNSAQTELLSSYLATVSIGPNSVKQKNKSNLICKLEKYQLTQQIYFKCDEPLMRSERDLQTQIAVDTSLISTYLNFILFESDKLFPIARDESLAPFNLSNYELINLVDYNSAIDTGDSNGSVDKTCSQIVGIMGQVSQSQIHKFNLTLEVKIPDSYSQMLSLIKSKLENKTNEILIQKKELKKVEKKIEKDRNLFDQIFSTSSQNSLGEFYYLSEISNQKNQVLLVNKNLVLNNANIINANFLNANRLKNLKKNLIKKWFNLKNYEILSGIIVKQNNSQSIDQIEWLNQSKCKLFNLQSNFKNDSNQIRLFASLICSLKIQKPDSKIQFLGLGIPNSNTNSTTSHNLTEPSLGSIINMIDQYALMFNFDLNEDSNPPKSFITKFNTILVNNYEFFKFKIIYFSSITSSILLLTTILIYILFHKNLMMPRSFYHVLINKWISVLFLVLFYALGINQIFIPHLCLTTGVLTHYFVLCAFVWYLLYFWCLFSKLNKLEKRNFGLIFKNRGQQPQKGDEYYEDDFDSDEYMKRPVVHLYMLGWGVPCLLISIIVSITKRDYIQTPFSYCFTNEPNIQIGSILVPIGVVGVAQFVFIGLILFTLRKIVKDLREDDKIENGDTIENKVEDKSELCKNWINTASPKQLKQDELISDLKENDLIEIKMNPQTQKSLIVNNNFGAYSRSDTSLTNTDSDRTSIMDTQHRPHMQLKFSLFSWILFGIICTSASFLVNFSDYEKLSSYIFSVFLFVYSILQISFYVLSRDDLLLLRFNLDFKFNFPAKKKTQLHSETSEGSTESNTDLNNENNWYFEPKVANTDNSNDKAKDLQDSGVDNVENVIYEKYKPKQIENDQKIGTSLEESSDDTENDHKKSMSDVIFSNKNLTLQSSVNISIKSTSSEVITSEATSTSNTNVQTDSMNTQTGLYPTLAIQEEDTSDYVSLPQNNSIIKRPTHVRNASILSGSNTQTLQLIANENYVYESCVNRSSVKRASISQSKRPPYVYVDYSYEEKMYHDPISPSLGYSKEARQEEIIVEEYLANASLNSDAKLKLDDFLRNNSCSAQTGTAIESVACLVRNNNNNIAVNVTKPKPRSRSNGSVASSLVSTSNESNINSNLVNNNNNNNNSVIYGDSSYQIYSNVSNRSSQLSSSCMTPNQQIYGQYSNNHQQQLYQQQQPYQMPRKSIAARQSSSTLPTGNRVHPKTNTVRNGSLLRNNLLRANEIEIKNETSV